MRNYLIITFLTIISIPSNVHANEEDFNLHRFGIYGELGGRSDPEAVGGEIGMSAYMTKNISFKLGAAFLAAESFDDYFGGITLGARYNWGERFSPFAGLGGLAGYANEEIPAENDDIDNDDDGSTDEDGEKETKIDDVIASVYPEIGFHYWITNNFRLTFASKYHFTTKSQDQDFVVFNFGIAFYNE